MRIAGETVNDVDPQDRNIAMVFQNYALYPHMSVYDNMGFGLRLHGLKKREIRERVLPAAEMLGLTDLLKRKGSSPAASGSVAMGQAIVREPDALLMDEPLSNLDAKLRVEMRAYVSFLHQRLRTTTVYVTHDDGGDDDGRPRRRHARRPTGAVRRAAAAVRPAANLFVAGFIGSPAMNLVRSSLTGRGLALLEFGGTVIQLTPSVLERCPRLRSHVGRDVVVGIGPRTSRMRRSWRSRTAVASTSTSRSRSRWGQR